MRLTGESIRAAREAENLSQAELAEKLGVSLRSVQGWESGRVPQPKHRRELAAWVQSVKAPA